MLNDAAHIRDLVTEEAYHRSRHDRDQIARDLHAMDDLFHHIKDEVAGWRPSHSSQDHHYRRDPYRGRGSLRTRMARLEQTLHHMMQDYGERRVTNRERGGSPGAFDRPVPQE